MSANDRTNARDVTENGPEEPRTGAASRGHAARNREYAEQLRSAESRGAGRTRGDGARKDRNGMRDGSTEVDPGSSRMGDEPSHVDARDESENPRRA